MRAISRTRASFVSVCTAVYVLLFSCFLTINRWLSAMAAICARCVTQMTCAFLETQRSLMPTLFAASPLMPVSISSKICVSAAPESSDSTVLMASIIRESSPPDAIFDIGFGSSPAFAETRNWMRSQPKAVNGVRSCSTVKTTPGMLSSESSCRTRREKLSHAARRFADSCFASVTASFFFCSYCCKSSSFFSSENSMSESSARARSRNESISSSVSPYLRLKR